MPQRLLDKSFEFEHVSTSEPFVWTLENRDLVGEVESFGPTSVAKRSTLVQTKQRVSGRYTSAAELLGGRLLFYYNKNVLHTTTEPGRDTAVCSLNDRIKVRRKHRRLCFWVTLVVHTHQV